VREKLFLQYHEAGLLIICCNIYEKEEYSQNNDKKIGEIIFNKKEKMSFF